MLEKTVPLPDTRLCQHMQVSLKYFLLPLLHFFSPSSTLLKQQTVQQFNESDRRKSVFIQEGITIYEIIGNIILNCKM